MRRMQRHKLVRIGLLVSSVLHMYLDQSCHEPRLENSVSKRHTSHILPSKTPREHHHLHMAVQLIYVNIRIAIRFPTHPTDPDSNP